MRVLINDDIDTTRSFFGLNDQMRSMAGDGVLYRVDRVFDSSKYHGKALKIRGHTWYPDDVSLPEIKPKQKTKYKFDIEQLDITGV